MSKLRFRFSGKTYWLGRLAVPVVGVDDTTSEVLLGVGGAIVRVKASDLE